jgi:hypothetical protein
VPVPCSSLALANAITAANAAPAVLRLASHCTYNLTTALPQITGNVTLAGGPNTTINRDPATNNIRILDVAAAGTLGVRGIFILNGGLTSGDGPGIRNAGTLRLNFTTVSGNFATTGNGGGVANTGRASIANSVIAANLILIGNGAGINNGDDMTITTSGSCSAWVIGRVSGVGNRVRCPNDARFVQALSCRRVLSMGLPGSRRHGGAGPW